MRNPWALGVDACRGVAGTAPGLLCEDEMRSGSVEVERGFVSVRRRRFRHRFAVFATGGARRGREWQIAVCIAAVRAEGDGDAACDPAEALRLVDRLAAGRTVAASLRRPHLGHPPLAPGPGCPRV